MAHRAQKKRRGRGTRQAAHRAHRKRRLGGPLLATLVALTAIVGVVAAGAVLAAVEAPPALAATRVLPPTVTFPGAAPTLAWPPHGESAVEVDGLGSLGTAGPSTPVPIASVAKVMTAYLVLVDHPLAANGSGGLSVTITAADAADQAARAAQAQSTIAVAAGEVITEQQLLEGLLVPSGNNAASLLAVADAGSEAAFVAKMNAQAKALGMTSTTYTDPSGFTPTTTSTASDQLRLAQAAMAIPAFAQIVAMPQATLPVAGVVKNLNTLIGTDGFTGIKTGSDSSAGASFVFADQRTVDGVPLRIVGVVLGQDTGVVNTSVLVGAALAASQRLADSVVASLSMKPVLPAGSPVASVTNPDGRSVPVTTATTLSRLGYGGMRLPVTATLPPIGSHLVAGQEVGTVRVGPAGSPSTAAVARDTMPAVSWWWRVLHVV